MSLIIKESPHWYDALGTPRHDADLRKARKEKLLPSVTTVLNVWPKPMLEGYKIERAILAAEKYPRLAGENDKNYVDRVYEASHEHREGAADFGKALHGVCEQINLSNGDLPPNIPEHIARHAAAYQKWYANHVRQVFSAETVAVDTDLGFAGTYDLAAEVLTPDGVVVPAVVDIKNQNWKTKPAPNVYDTWEFQLAAYAKAINKYIPGLIQRLANVVLNSDPAAPDDRLICVHFWDPKDLDTAYEKFLSCLRLWQANKNYYPQKV